MNFCVKSSGQFQPASVVESTTGFNPVNTGNAGTDIFMSNYAVVWDDPNSNSGIITNAGTALFTYSDAIDPDVVFVQEYGGSKIYLITAYYSNSTGGYVWEPFLFSGGLTSLGATILTVSSFQTAINVDGDDQGDFVIVWDRYNGSNYLVESVTGSTNTGSTPKLNNASSVFTVATDGAFPDVCIYDASNSTTRSDIVYYTFNDHLYRYVYVDAERWTDLNDNPPTNPNPQNNIIGNYSNGSGIHTVIRPRIACANPWNGLSTDYTVVFEDHDLTNSANNIKALNCSGGCGTSPATIVYTDNSQSNLPTLNPKMNSLTCYNPVVSYDYANAYVYVGWTYDNSAPTYGAPASQGWFPVVIICDNTATPQTGYRFLEVPSSPGFQDHLSIAGRFDVLNLNTIYTFFDLNNYEVYYKTVSQGSFALKLGSGNSSIANLIYPNPFSKSLTINFPHSKDSEIFSAAVFDLTERQLFNELRSYNELKINLETLSDQLKSGIYCLKIQNEEGSFSLTDKLVKL